MPGQYLKFVLRLIKTADTFRKVQHLTCSVTWHGSRRKRMRNSHGSVWKEIAAFARKLARDHLALFASDPNYRKRAGRFLTALLPPKPRRRGRHGGRIYRDAQPSGDGGQIAITQPDRRYHRSKAMITSSENQRFANNGFRSRRRFLHPFIVACRAKMQQNPVHILLLSFLCTQSIHTQLT
jgi:hypothetical protein